MNSELLLGAHLSTSGGLEQALLTGQRIGCTTIQIFTHSNRQWKIKPLDEEIIKKFDHARKATGVTQIVAHASYLINLASPNTQTRELSIKTVTKELELCKALTIPYLVLHPGSTLDAPVDISLAAVAQGLDQAIEAAGSRDIPMILLENMAGQGSVLGSTFEELATIFNRSKHKKHIGFCFDTCHADAAGYDLTNQIAYENTWKQFNMTIGLEHLKVIHINDSKTAQGSHVDRHAHIGMGTMGIMPFKLIMNDSRFTHIPKIIETPKDESLADDIRNLKILRELRS